MKAIIDYNLTLRIRKEPSLGNVLWIKFLFTQIFLHRIHVEYGKFNDYQLLFLNCSSSHILGIDLQCLDYEFSRITDSFTQNLR
ncbi:hypothetical protein LEP1GSC088_4348 [Leptospira interrogans str. L1207]|nr:hypothetical protein LEP1GSC088_4348 [Leptospira interrogans str. L1207]